MDEEIILCLPQDINKLCRTCMTLTENILSHNIVLVEDNKPTLAAEMLESCTSANIYSDDELPKSICIECTQKLEIAYNFKLLCQQTEKNLQELLNLTTEPHKKSKNNTPSFVEIGSVPNSNNSENIDTCAKGVVLYENISNKNFIDNSIEFDEENVLRLEVLLEENRKNHGSLSALSSRASKTSSQIEILTLIEERKSAEYIGDPKENSLKNNELNSYIQNKKRYILGDSFTATSESDNSDPVIKTEILSDDEQFDEHVCSYCNVSLQSTDDLITHLQDCDGTENKLALEKILKLENESMVSVEIYEEDENFPPFVCKICGIYFKTKCARNGHMATHGPNNAFVHQDAELRCDLCSKVYSNEAKLATHFQRHALGAKKDIDGSRKQESGSEAEEQNGTDCDEYSNDQINKYTIKCNMCSSTFRDEINLVKHMKKHGVQISICKICLRRFESPVKLKEHMKMHWSNHTGKKYRCPICKEQFPSAITLRNHAAVHLNENHDCTRCKRSFNNKFSFEKHMKQHNEPRFLCSECGKQYFSSVTLACHIRSHNNEKPFVCQFCKKGFSSRATLSVHKRIHSTFKPYICNYCGYSCRQSGDLAMHIRTHTGVKPYKCTFPNCERKFTTSSQRKEHYRRHTNERNHKCPECQKAFLESKTLKVHMLTHTGEKPHSCDICGKKFRRTHHLANHMKGHK